jgi:hypothetical protein
VRFAQTQNLIVENEVLLIRQNCHCPAVKQKPADHSHRAKKYLDLFRFASYIAVSALVTNVSAVAPSFGKIEIPILAMILRLNVRSRVLILHGA